MKRRSSSSGGHTTLERGAVGRMTVAAPPASRSRDVAIAFSVVVLVMGAEYSFRHFVMFWAPVIGTPLVNDMLALCAVYVLLAAALGAATHLDWPRALADVRRELGEGLQRWSFTRWVLLLVLAIWVLSVVDRLLWGRVALPMSLSASRNPHVWGAALAPILKPVTLLVVNGFVVPVAEEFLWRGIVQVRLAHVLPAPVAIGLTAVFFSLKHALVDASLARLLTLIAFGAICGILARRDGWKRSAALHLVVNTVLTATTLVSGRA